MATYTYQNLIVWQKAMELVESTYKITKKLPKEETYGLISQMRRCAVSVPSNIAEGQKRLNLQETIQCTGIALGSIAELETQLLLCLRIYNINTSKELGLCVEVGKMAAILVRKLRSEI